MNSLGWLGRRFGVYTGWTCISEMDLHEPIPEINPPIELEFGIASSDDLRSIEDRLAQRDEQFVGGDSAKELFTKAKDLNGTCFIVKTNGQVAGYTWVKFRDVPFFFGAVVRYPPDTAHTFNGMVFPEFRAKGVFQFLSSKLYAYLRSQGYRYVCNFIHPHNVPAIRAKQRAGARVTELRFTRLPWGQVKLHGPCRFEVAPHSAKSSF